MAGNWIQFSFFLFNTMLNTLEVEPQANIVPKQTRKQRNFWKGWVWWCVLVVHSEGWRQKDQEFKVLHSWPGIHKSLYRKGARWSANYRNIVHWRQPVNSQQWGVGGRFKKTLRLWVYSTFRKGIWMLGKYITKFQVVGSVVFLFFFIQWFYWALTVFVLPVQLWGVHMGWDQSLIVYLWLPWGY